MKLVKISLLAAGLFSLTLFTTAAQNSPARPAVAATAAPSKATFSSAGTEKARAGSASSAKIT